MKRREFIALFGGAAAWPFAARAQQAMPVIGYLNTGSPGPFEQIVRAFRQGLSETGYVEGRNVVIEYHWADGHLERMPAIAADVVGRNVTAIVAGGNAAVLAAKGATKTIPIVFQTGTDPIEDGFVASFNRPGGNLTGVTSMNLLLGPKLLALLRELVPMATIFALLLNPANPGQTETISRDMQAAARTLGLQLHNLRASTESELDAAFATMVELRAGGLVIAPDGFFNSRAGKIAELAARHAVPAIYPFLANAAAGGLMSYGGSLADQYHQVGVYIGRILKGEKPADLPVQQPTKVELIVNLRTAKALGITVPVALLTRADEVIE
jgi:putative tryptophan/tyrosine transport system substrate-binding protein